MNRFRKIIRYTKPLTEIDEKINRLNEMMVTSGLYNTGLTVDPQNEQPPTYEQTPDSYMGDFLDLNTFEQNSDASNVDQLQAENACGEDEALFDSMDTSMIDPDLKPLGMATNPRPAQGVEWGYLDGNNVFHAVFTIGGMNASGYGMSAEIDAGLNWWYANVKGKSVDTVSWKCFNSPSIWDGLYTPLAQNVGPNEAYNLHINQLVAVRKKDFCTDPGEPHKPGQYIVITRDDLGNVDYLDILTQVSTLVADGIISAYQAAAALINQLIQFLSNIPDYYTAAQQLGAYANWLPNPTDTYTETFLDSADKAEIISGADTYLETHFNSDGSPKTDLPPHMIDHYIGQSIQAGINGHPAASNIHANLPITDPPPPPAPQVSDIIVHNKPTNDEGISPDGEGGININDGFDFNHIGQLEVGGVGPGVVGPIQQIVTSLPTEEIVGQPRQPIQTNISGDQLDGTLLGNVLDYHNLLESKKVDKSSVLLETKSGIPDKYKLLKFMSIDKEALKKLQERYPSSDPRLAELNWKMDTMVKASNTYVQKHFPENVKQTSRVKKILARNIELTDPKTFEESKQPTIFENLYENYTDYKKLKVKESARKFFGKGQKKKSYNSVLRHVSMTDVKKNTRKLQEQKLIDEQCHQEKLDIPKYNSSQYSNWRFDLDKET